MELNVGASAPLHYDDPRLAAARAKTVGLEVVLGLDQANQEPLKIKLDADFSPHLLIAGAPGSGKTNILGVILAQLVERLGPDELELMFIDPTLVQSELFRGLPHISKLFDDADLRAIAATEGEAEVIFAQAEAKVHARQRLFADNGIIRVSSWNRAHPEQKLPYILVVVPNVRNLGDEAHKAYLRHAGYIARAGREAGVILIAATTRPTVHSVGLDVLQSVAKRLILRQEQLAESALLLERDSEGDRRSLTLAQGEALLFSYSDEPPIRPVSLALLPDRGSEHAGRTINDVLDAVRAHYV